MSDEPRWFVSGVITRWIADDPQPGIVEFQLTDVAGRNWCFVGKFYDFTSAELCSDSIYPQEGSLACQVTKRGPNASGLEIATINTDSSYLGHESEEGIAELDVPAELVVSAALPEQKITETIVVTGIRRR